DDPAGFAQKYGCVDRPGDDMQHATIGCAKVTGDIAAVFLLIDNPKSADLLVRRHEMFVEIIADFPIREGVHPERLGVVSCEAGVVKIAGDVQKEDELVLLGCQRRGVGGGADEIDCGVKSIGNRASLGWTSRFGTNRGKVIVIFDETNTGCNRQCTPEAED